MARTQTTPTPRGQGATEYLVILAVVLIIVMVVIYIINSASSTSGSSSKSASQAYWSSLTPLAITDAAQVGALRAKISIQNTGARELKLNRLVLSTPDGLYSYTNSSAPILLPGQKRVINVALDANVIDCTTYGGKSPNTYSVFMSYDDDPITGKVFNSTTKLLATACST